MNLPNNIMTYQDAQGKSNNLSPAAISLFTPSIIQFVGKDKITGGDDSKFDERSDFYIYKNITSSQGYDNVYLKMPNASLIFGSERGIYNDTVVTSYLPFISNCEELGSHITFKNLLEHPKCNLIEKNKTTTFKFANFFAEAIGDNCDYTTTCFYDESFDSAKNNWMQFDYSLSREPLMNISKYAIDSDMYNKYVREFTMSVPDDLDAYNFTKLMSMVPLYMETEVTRLKSQDRNAIFIPRTIELTILYYTDENGERTIILPKLKLSDFEKLASKNDVEKVEYMKLFPNPPGREPIASKIYQFFKNQYEMQYMGIENMIKLYLYSNTTQFGEHFSDYFDYKKMSKDIMELASKLSNQTGAKQTIEDIDLTPDLLESYFKNVSAITFAEQASTQKLEEPVELPINPNKASDIHEEAVFNEFKDAYKNYYYNAYILNKHFYNFRVIIRPATWLEALNYNAFELYTYVITSIILLSMIFGLYVILYVIWRYPILRKVFRLSVNNFNEKKYEKLQFWEQQKCSSPFCTVKELFKNCILANIITSLPVYTLAIGFLFLFCYSNIFLKVPSTINEKGTDYNNPNDPNVVLMLKRNQLARFAVALISLGFLAFYYGSSMLTPDHEKELVAAKVIKPEQIKERSGQRWYAAKPIFYTILFLTIFISSISNFFTLSAIFQIVSAALYQLLISTIIENIFNKKTLTCSIIITLLELSIFDLILESTDFNIMLCLYLTYQFIKFFKILFNEKFSRFFNYVTKKCRRQTFEEKLLQEDRIGHVNEDMEMKTLNVNMITLTDVSTYICNDLIIIPFVVMKLSVLLLTNASETSIFNTMVLLIFASMTLVIDFFNFWLLLQTNTIKDGKHYNIYPIRPM
jgi:hypothetical protein